MAESRPLRMLHTEASMGWGGQEIRILTEASGLRARGHDVRIAAAPRAEIIGGAQRYGVPLYRVPINRRGPRAVWSLRRLLATFQPHVVVTHSSTDTWLMALAVRLSSPRPALVRMRHLSTPVPKNVFSRWLYGPALDRLVTTGAAIRLTLIDQFGLDPNFIVSIPTGTDLARFRPGDREVARRTLNLPSHGPIIGIVATLRGWKGHSLLVAAMNDARLARATLLIVGDGPQEGALRAQVAELGLAERVIFAGRQNDVAPWLQAMDVFVLPSTGHETTPQAIQQAMACGIPVVTTPAGAGLELVQDDVTGVVIDAPDPEAIAGGVARVLTDRALAQRLSSAGPKHVAARFTDIAMLDAMEALLREVADERGLQHNTDRERE